QNLDAADALFDTATTLSKLEYPQIARINQFVKSLALEKDFILTVFLRRLQVLAERVKDNGWDWSTAVPAVQQSLRTVRQAERAVLAVAQEPGAFPWVLERLNAADQERRHGEKALFLST